MLFRPTETDPKSFYPMRAKLIGKIVLARFLERSPASVLAAVHDAEDVARCSGLFDEPIPAMRRRMLPGATLELGVVPDEAVGRVRMRKGRPVLGWRAASFAFEYIVDGPRLAACLQQGGEATTETILRAVRTLLLVTTRNRITHKVCQVLLRVQREFLRTANEARLVPLTGRDLARAVQTQGLDAADASRVSRVLRSTVLVLPNGTSRPLRMLCPTSRRVLGALVRDVLDRERMLRGRGRLKRAWADDEIARRVQQRPDVFVSRRLVAYCRKNLGSPGARGRMRRSCYMAITMDFSSLARLDRQGILCHAPTAPGVYELRLAPGERGHVRGCAGVIYVGKAKNLRRRLLAHASGNGRNKKLSCYVRQARLSFRYRVENGEIKRAEEELYRQFRETYGRPPECNQISP